VAVNGLASATGTAAGASVAKERNWLVDNCRAVLILLVVTGHMLGVYDKGITSLSTLHYFIDLFHMPAFAFLSGYVITSAKKTADRAIVSLLPLYLGLTLVQFLALRLYFGTWVWGLALSPGVLWYLLALMFWRLLLPIFDRLRYPIITAFALSLIVGLSGQINLTLSLSRCVAFLPYFLMGFYIPRDWQKKVRSTRVIFGILALAGVAAVAWVLATTKFIPLDALIPPDSYKAVTHSVLRGVIARFLSLAGFSAGIFGLARLMPAVRTRFTYIGRNSLNIYVLHLYVIYLLRLYYPHLGSNLLFDTLALLTPIPIAVLLATRPVSGFIDAIERLSRRVLSPLLGPRAPKPQVDPA
jgi:fucose 4-O-acetylase-like acetyltransferase